MTLLERVLMTPAPDSAAAIVQIDAVLARQIIRDVPDRNEWG